MKKFFYAVSVLSLFVFMSCQQPNGSTGDNENTYSKWGSLEAKVMYNSFLGTWELENESVRGDGAESVIFASDSITVGSLRYNLNQDTDLIKSEDYAGDGALFPAGNYPEQLCVKLNDRFMVLQIGKSCREDYYYGFITWNLYQDGSYNSIIRVSKSTSAGGGEESASSVNGTYSFSNATGTQSNGTITLSDGNFTYSGGKNMAPSSGTYTVSGSDITFTWTASGYTVNTTVTMTKDGSSVTFSSSEVVFFSTFFGSTDQSGGKYSLTFSYSE